MNNWVRQDEDRKFLTMLDSMGTMETLRGNGLSRIIKMEMSLKWL